MPPRLECRGLPGPLLVKGQESSMSNCLNPHGSHPVSGEGILLCPHPLCGFLVEGAIVGRWRVVRFLRRNTTASLYLAVPHEGDGMSRTRSPVVVRILHHFVPGAQSLLKPLLSLRHPHIHPLLHAEWLESHALIALVSTFEEGGSLARYLQTTSSLSAATIVTIIRQIAEALQFAHDHTFVHGRLKPENCLLVAPGLLQVSDFYYSVLVGTARAMSGPFDSLQNGMSPAEDQVALAMVARLMLCKFLVVLAERAGQAVAPHWLDPKSVAPLLPFANPLDQTLLRAMSRQVNEQFPDVRQFAQTFAAACEQVIPYITRNMERKHSSSQPLPPRSRSLPGEVSRFLNSGEFSPRQQEFSPRQQEFSPRSRSLPGEFSPRLREVSPLPREFSPREWPNGRPSSRSGEFPAIPAQKQNLVPGNAVILCRMPGHIAPISAVSWAPDGLHLASADHDGNVWLWLVQHRVGTPLGTFAGHEKRVHSLSWSPDGSLLASSSIDASICLWQRTDGENAQLSKLRTMHGHHSDIYVVAWSPDGQLLASGGKDRTVRLWGRDGKPLHHWKVPGKSGVRALCWSPSLRLIATASDRMISLWQAEQGTSLHQWEAHTDEVHTLRWSPDGRFLASSGGRKDARVCLWNPQNGQLLAEFTGFAREVVELFWSPDSSWLGTISADHFLRFWQVQPLPGKQVGQPFALESMPLAASATRGGVVAVGMEKLSILVLQSV